MNILNQIQIIYVPWWVRLLVLTLLVGALAMGGYMIFTALTTEGKTDWIPAATSLLTIVFPIFLVVIVASGASFGERSIVKKTERMLVQTIPYHLQFLPEERRKFKDFRRFKRAKKTSKDQLAKIRLFHSRGRCYADYKVQARMEGRDLAVDIRVELNVKRANINVLFEQDYVLSLMTEENFDGNELAFLRSQFPHCISVEERQAAEKDQKTEDSQSTIAYKFSSDMLTRRVDKTNYVVVVASTGLPDDTVWNPSERVFFAQDLMFMVRAFMQENPVIFERPSPSNA